MKFKVLAIILLFCVSLGALAQNGHSGRSGGNMERVKAMKVGIITEKLALSGKQAQGFWPIYNKYEHEKWELNSQLRTKMRSQRGQELNEKQEIAKQDAIFELREEELALSKKYRPAFLKVISAKQFSDLVFAEKEFNQMLLRELRQRRGDRSSEK
ncbi:MAG: hypothetical protein ACI9IP_000930 [Arcticibacterium sp.]|jgi:hypothetical protein